MRENNADAKRQAIIDVIAGGKKPTTREVMAAIGLPRNNTATYLNELARKGQIRKVANYDGSKEARWDLPLDGAKNMDNPAPVVGDALPRKREGLG